jgi:hypothetical protein
VPVALTQSIKTLYRSIDGVSHIMDAGHWPGDAADELASLITSWWAGGYRQV